MVKKILVISLLVASLFTFIAIVKADDVEPVIGTNGIDDSILYDSLSYTQEDDISINANKGSLSASDRFVTSSEDGKLSLYLNEGRCLFKIKNNVTGYVYSSALENVYEGEATASTYAPYMSSSFVLQYYLKQDTYDNLPQPSNLFMNVVEKYDKDEKEAMGEMDVYPYDIQLSDGVELSYSDIENGKKVSLTINSSYKDANKNVIDISIGFNAYISLTNEGLDVYIPDSEITESNVYLSSIIVMPALGATADNSTPGYMVIPDGSGALLRYGSVAKPSQQYLAIYGEDEGSETLVASENVLDVKTVSLPVFGLINGINQDGVYGIIKEGQYNAYLILSPSGSFNIDYNFYTVRYQKRKYYLEYGVNYQIYEERNSENIDVTYKFLSNDEANYVGMANSYQDYLIKNGELIKTSSGSYETRFDFLLGDSTKALIGTKNLVMTSILDVENILSELRDSGMEGFFINLLGWSKGGFSGTTPVKIKYNTSVSSRNAYLKLIKNETALGNVVSFYNNYVEGYQNGNFNKISDVARSIMNLKMSYVDEDITLYQTSYYLYPESSLSIAEKDVKKYNNNKISALTLDGIGNNLFSFYKNKVYYNRATSAKYYQDTLETLSGMSSYLVSPNSYLFKYMEAYLDMPLFTTAYTFYTDTVPFLPYVLRGVTDCYAKYMNFTANQTDYLLRMLDYGVLPSYVLTEEDSYNLKYTDAIDFYTTKFDDWKDTIINNDSVYKEIYSRISDSQIESRTVILSGVVLNEYSNGLKLIINYTGNTITYDEYSIGPNSFKVVS